MTMQPPDAGPDPLPNPDPHPALDGATTALQRRIEELTAELRVTEAGHAATKEALKQTDCALATERAAHAEARELCHRWETARNAERAAREQAESALERMTTSRNTSEHTRIMAERERDTALARVKELEAIKPLLDAEKLTAAESALASARGLLANMAAAPHLWLHDAQAWLSSRPAPAAVQYAAPPPAPAGTPAHLVPKPGHVYPVSGPVPLVLNPDDEEGL